jgi:hypothetical protein
VFGSVVWAAGGDIRILELKHRPAEEILPVVLPLLGQDGAATALDNRLILRAPSKDLAAIEKLVSQLDVARATLRIAVRQERSSGGIQISGSEEGRTDRHLSTAPRMNAAEESSRVLGNARQNTEQYLQVLDGETALIEVGRQIPYPRIRAYVGGRHRGVVEVTDFQEVATGFVVRPRLLGDKVALEITPYQSTPGQGPAGTVDFGGISSQVEAPLGEWFDLGGHLERETETGGPGRSLRAGPGSDARHLWIKVTR